MSNGLELFGIPFQICNERQLYEESCDFLEEPVLHTIIFVAAIQCNMMADIEETIRRKEQLLWIPGDDAVKKVLPKKERHAIGDFSIQRYIMKLCEYAVDMGLDVCVLMNGERELELIMDEIRQLYPYLALRGLSTEHSTSTEGVINEINSIAPEILISGIRFGELRRFIEGDRHKTNARLCICVGDLLTDEMSKKKKLFHTITMSRALKKRLRKYSIKEHEQDETIQK